MRSASIRVRAAGRGTLARAALLLVVFASVAGCASSPPPAAPATPVAITDYKMVAGKWAGLVKGLAGPRDNPGDWVEMNIAESGAYDFGVARTIGMLTGKGNLTFKDGKLALEGERGEATFALYEREGKKLLRVDGKVRAGGSPLSGELTQAR
jgi:hypothetical protein